MMQTQLQNLLSELLAAPGTWTLTPTDGNKRPYRKNWQHEAPLSRDEIAANARAGKAQGFGVRSGRYSAGLLCVDFDGHSAKDKWLELSGGVAPPLTVGWTSGKPGRCQLAFNVPLEFWDDIATKKIPTGWDGNGKPTEYLELRWDGCQSVLPGSVHPQTGSYKWLPGQSPAECEIVPVPNFILEAALAEQKYQPRERAAASNPVDDPWDIRNFAAYLDDYRPDGRRAGWDTCKCPAHNGQSADSLHIEQSSGAFKCHAGCSPKDIHRAALELAQACGYVVPERQRSPRSFSDSFGWLSRLKQRFQKQRQTPWGVGRKGEVEVEVEAPQQKVIKYGTGDRVNVWSALNHLGAKHFQDSSDTGTGKSFDAGRLTPEMLPDAWQIIYVSREHRNPSTPTLKNWPDLDARHDGLYRDSFGKLRRVDKGQPYVVPPTCGRNKTIGALRAKNISLADTAELVCTTCKSFEMCRAGVAYGFLNQRAEILQETRFRAHPDSLPNPEKYDYSQTAIIWDESEQIFKAHRSTEVKAEDIARTIADLMAKLPDQFDKLRPLLTQLHLYITDPSTQPNRYGWSDAELRPSLPDLGEIDLDAIREVLEPLAVKILDGGADEHGVGLADMPRSVRTKFSDRDEFTADRIATELALFWLSDFLDVLAGNRLGTLRIQHGTLTISVGNDRFQRIAAAASCNIYLDATAKQEDLARAVGVDLSEFLVCQQTVEASDNLEVIQVATVGRLGQAKRSDFCIDRIEALIAQIQKEATGATGTIDLKRHTKKGDGKRHWWADNRLINDLEDCQTLILIGTPCPNLGELEAEFTALHGRHPAQGTRKARYPIQVIGQPSPDLQPYFEMEVSADPEFAEFTRRKILAEIKQGIGRLRANRRPGEHLKVYIIADYPLDFPVKLRKASQITPEAATQMERFEMALKAGIQQLRDAGQKVTQSALAAITGYSQQYISRFKELLLSLVDPNSKSSKTSDPPPDPDEAEWVGQVYLPMVAEMPPPELLTEVLDTFEAYGKQAFKPIWDAVPATAQIKILSALALTLPASELQVIFAAGAIS